MNAHRRAGTRRLLVGVACLGALAALLVTGGSTAVAAADITGKVRAAHSNGSRPPVPGVTIRLWTNEEGDPGSLVDTDVTDDDGNFDVSPPSAGGYFLQLVGADYRNGWLDDSNHFWRLGPHTVLVRPGADLTPTYAVPTFVAGRIVQQSNGEPVEGVRAIVIDPGDMTVLGRARSLANGRFRVDDVVLGDDTVQMKFNGSAVGYETGYLSCRRTVVPTMGEGCASGLGLMGRVKIQRS